MKKVFYLVLFILVSFLAKAQYPVNQSLGSDSTMVLVKGGIKGRVVLNSFTDTAQANLQRIKSYPVALIFTTSDSSLWIRSTGGTKWDRVYTSGGSATNPNLQNVTDVNNETTNNLIVNSGFGSKTYQSGSSFVIEQIATNKSTSINATTLTDDRTATLQDTSGTIAFLHDITGGTDSSLTAGFGLTKTTLGNAITLKVDTSLIATQYGLDAKQDTLKHYGYMVDTALSHSVSGGDNNYYNNALSYGTGSASLVYKESIEFTLTTKPTANTEGIWLGRLSGNSFSRSSLVARAVYVDANNWTINLYAVFGFTTSGATLVASTPIYTPNSIAMTNGANYRIEISFNSPNIQIDFSRIDTTLSYEKSVIEKIYIPYTYTTFIGNNPQIPNTGYWSYGAIGSTPSGVYVVRKMKVFYNSFKNTDFAVVGNSIATGYNSSSPTNTWTNMIFSGSNKTYSVFAGPSDRTADVLLRLDEIWQTNPKYVLLEMGWNDIGDAVGSAVFSANLSKIIDSIQSHNITPIVLQLPQTGFGYDTAFVNVCFRKNVKLINVGNTLIGSLDAFDIHPNDRGNMIIANLVKLRCAEIFGTANPLLLDNNQNVLSKTVNSNTSADINTNKYYIDASGGNVTLTLYAADIATIGKVITVVRTDGSGNTVTVASLGSNTINGTSSVTIGSQYETLFISGVSSTGWVSSKIGNSSGGASVITVGTTTITSGTSGAIPFNNAGVYGEDAAQLFWDNTNNRLGIGTNAPASPIHLIHGSGASDVTIQGLTTGTTHTSYTTKGRWGSNFNHSYFSQNARYDGAAWVADDVNKPTSGFELNNFTSAQGLISFYTSQTNNAGRGTETVRFNYDGNVGMSNGLYLGSVSTSPAASAKLEIASTTQGFLPPRMTTTQQNAISSPATGLTVYNTTTNGNTVYNSVNWAGGVVIDNAATLTLTHGVDYVFSGTTTTWTLPAINSAIQGRSNMITIKNRGTGNITLNTNAAANVMFTNSLTNTITLSVGDAVILMPDGTYFNVE